MARTTGDKTYYGLDKIRTEDRMREKWPEFPTYISPLPYYSTLRRVLRSHGAAVLCVYFEVFHSIDTNVVLAHVQQELQITGRAWWWIANAITVRHLTLNNRRIAQLAHREFVKDQKGIHGLVMPYSLSAVNPDRKTWEIRRNQTVLDNLLQKAHLTASMIRSDAAKLLKTRRPVLPEKSNVKVTHQPPATISAPTAFDHANKLSDIIETALAKRVR